jgi:hypothetical protein
MVEEFGRRLREELNKIEKGINEQRRRALTTDTARMSIDSLQPQRNNFHTAADINAAYGQKQ